MKQKLLKLAKILKRFTLDDVLSMEDFDEDKIKDIIEELLKENRIKIYRNQYVYLQDAVEKPKTTSVNKTVINVDIDISKQNPEELFLNKEDLEFYNSNTFYNRKNIIKFLTLFHLTKGLGGENLRDYLKAIGERNPQYKCAYSTYHRYSKRYKELGIKALVAHHASIHTPKTMMEPEIYAAFKKHYLSPMKYSVDVAWRKTVEEFPNDYVPAAVTLKRHLDLDYSQECISQMRATPIDLPSIDPSKKTIFEKFIDAAKYQMQVFENMNSDSARNRKQWIKKFLIPAFGKFRIMDITKNDIILFQSKLIAEGYSQATIRRLISVLGIIIRRYSHNNTNIQFLPRFGLPTLETEVYSKKEIEEFKKKNCPELWIIALGVVPAELAVVRYEDIDFGRQTVKISKALFGDNEQVYRSKYRIRELKLPKALFEKLKRNGRGLVFGLVELLDFEKLMNTHIKLMLDKKVQVNIISKNLGYYNIKDFEQRYNFLLPQSLDEKFDIFE